MMRDDTRGQNERSTRAASRATGRRAARYTSIIPLSRLTRACPPRLTRLSWVAGALALLLWCLPATAIHGAETFFPVDQVKPGMRATAVTVLQGTTRSTFEIEI